MVTVSKGMNAPLSDMLSDILEPMVSKMKDSPEAISSKHFLNKVDKLNVELSKED